MFVFTNRVIVVLTLPDIMFLQSQYNIKLGTDMPIVKVVEIHA